MKKILSLTILFTILFSNNSFAEEIVTDETNVTQVQDESAWDQASGWAVVDSSGQVSNIIVCTNAVCGNDDFLNTAIQNGAIAPGSKIVRQTPTGGGYWGTYDNDTETFTIDRGCYNCPLDSDNYINGKIKDGVVSLPITYGQINNVLLEKPELTIDEAAQLVKELLKAYAGINAPENSTNAATMNTIIKSNGSVINLKKSKHKTIKLTSNLKDFKKISKTKNICKIKNNSVLILKTGTCKIDIYKDGKKEKVVAKVSK